MSQPSRPRYFRRRKFRRINARTSNLKAWLELQAVRLSTSVLAIITRLKSGENYKQIEASSGSPSVPVNLTPPSFSGTEQEGQTLTGVVGVYSNSPISIAHQWQYNTVSSGGTWVDISGATSINYTITGQTGRFLRRREIATNGVGSSTPVFTNITGAIAAAPSAARRAVIKIGQSNSAYYVERGGTYQHPDDTGVFATSYFQSGASYFLQKALGLFGITPVRAPTGRSTPGLSTSPTPTETITSGIKYWSYPQTESELHKHFRIVDDRSSITSTDGNIIVINGASGGSSLFDLNPGNLTEPLNSSINWQTAPITLAATSGSNILTGNVPTAWSGYVGSKITFSGASFRTGAFISAVTTGGSGSITLVTTKGGSTPANAIATENGSVQIEYFNDDTLGDKRIYGNYWFNVDNTTTSGDLTSMSITSGSNIVTGNVASQYQYSVGRKVRFSVDGLPREAYISAVTTGSSGSITLVTAFGGSTPANAVASATGTLTIMANGEITRNPSFGTYSPANGNDMGGTRLAPTFGPAARRALYAIKFWVDQLGPENVVVDWSQGGDDVGNLGSIETDAVRRADNIVVYKRCLNAFIDAVQACNTTSSYKIPFYFQRNGRLDASDDLGNENVRKVQNQIINERTDGSVRLGVEEYPWTFSGMVNVAEAVITNESNTITISNAATTAHTISSVTVNNSSTTITLSSAPSWLPYFVNQSISFSVGGVIPSGTQITNVSGNTITLSTTTTGTGTGTLTIGSAFAPTSIVNAFPEITFWQLVSGNFQRVYPFPRGTRVQSASGTTITLNKPATQTITCGARLLEGTHIYPNNTTTGLEFQPQDRNLGFFRVGELFAYKMANDLNINGAAASIPGEFVGPRLTSITRSGTRTIDCTITHDGNATDISQTGVSGWRVGINNAIPTTVDGADGCTFVGIVSVVRTSATTVRITVDTDLPSSSSTIYVWPVYGSGLRYISATPTGISSKADTSEFTFDNRTPYPLPLQATLPVFQVLAASSPVAAYKAAVLADGGTISTAFETILNNFYTALTATIYNKFDVFYLLANETIQGARVNFAEPGNSRYKLQPYNTGVLPTFVAKVGTGGTGALDATAGFWKTGFIPSTASDRKYQRDNATIGVYTTESTTVSARDLYDAQGRIQLSARTPTSTPPSSQTYVRLNNITNSIFPAAPSDWAAGGSASAPFLMTAVRDTVTPSPLVKLYRNGTQISNVTNQDQVSDSTLPNEITIHGNVNTTPVIFGLSDRKLGIVYVGSALTGSEVATLNTAVQAYITAVAAL